MKYLLLVITVLFSTNFLYAGDPACAAVGANNLMFNSIPDPPFSVGQKVAFTLDYAGQIPAPDCRCIGTDGRGGNFSNILVNGQVVLPQVNSNTEFIPQGGLMFDYTFLSPGDYTFSFECAYDYVLDNDNPVSGPSKKPQAKLIAGGLFLNAFTVGAAIPTLSQWGLIILGIAMLIFGIVAIMDGLIKSSTDSK